MTVAPASGRRTRRPPRERARSRPTQSRSRSDASSGSGPYVSSGTDAVTSHSRSASSTGCGPLGAGQSRRHAGGSRFPRAANDAIEVMARDMGLTAGSARTSMIPQQVSCAARCGVAAVRTMSCATHAAVRLHGVAGSLQARRSAGPSDGGPSDQLLPQIRAISERLAPSDRGGSASRCRRRRR